MLVKRDFYTLLLCYWCCCMKMRHTKKKVHVKEINCVAFVRKMNVECEKDEKSWQHWMNWREMCCELKVTFFRYFDIFQLSTYFFIISFNSKYQNVLKNFAHLKNSKNEFQICDKAIDQKTTEKKSVIFEIFWITWVKYNILYLHR